MLLYPIVLLLSLLLARASLDLSLAGAPLGLGWLDRRLGRHLSGPAHCEVTARRDGSRGAGAFVRALPGKRPAGLTPRVGFGVGFRHD